MIRLILSSLLIASPLFGVKINVVNNSTYTLHAKIYDRDQNELASFELSPDHTNTWFDSLYNAKDYSKGPFSVHFTCPMGDNYGTVYRIMDGGTARAKAARGPKKCYSKSQPLPHRDWENNLPHSKY